MVQASLPDFVSDQAYGRKLNVGHSFASFNSLDQLLPRNDETREAHLPDIKQGDPQGRVFKMAEHTVPASSKVAGIIGMSIYTRLPVVPKRIGFSAA